MPCRGAGGSRRPRPRAAVSPGGSRGMVTVELAIGCIVAVLVTACLVSLAMLGVAQSACAESSAQLARQKARGDAAALESARRRAPEGARISLTSLPDGVTAEVSVDVRIVGLGPVAVGAKSWAAYEPGEEP